MGLRGPAPTPTPIRIRAGNPQHRPINKREPKPAERRPDETGLLAEDELAKKHYSDLLTLTEHMRVLTEADGRPLEKIAYLEARFQEMADLVRKAGFLIANKRSGVVHINPAVKEMKEILGHLWRGYRDFGFTPASRAGLKTPETSPEDDPWAKF